MIAIVEVAALERLNKPPSLLQPKFQVVLEAGTSSAVAEIAEQQCAHLHPSLQSAVCGMLRLFPLLQTVFADQSARETPTKETDDEQENLLLMMMPKQVMIPMILSNLYY